MSQQPLPQDARFNQPMPSYAYRDDEISLVDLAKVLVKRRNWLFSTFIIGLLVTFLLAWLKRPAPVVENTNKEFTTLVTVGYKTPTVFIEPLAGIKTQLTDAFVPLATKSNSHNADVIIDNQSGGSNIIKLVTIAEQGQGESVSKYHEKILEPLLLRHERLVKELNDKYDNSTLESTGVQPIATSIASLAQPLNIPSTVAKSRAGLIVALGLILSTILAIVFVFIREFSSHVCASLRNDNK